MSQPFAWPVGARAAVSLSFDDARPSQLDQAMPILDRHGVRATFYVSPPAARKRRDEWAAAARRGHEMGNHSLTHPCSGNFLWSRGNALENMSLDDMEAQLTGATRFIRDELCAPVSTYAYCCGQKFVGRGRGARSFVPLVAKHFVVGRGFRDEDHNDPRFCDLAQAYGMDADMTPFETLRAQIERAAGQGGWALFAAHDVFDGPRQCMAPAVLDALCAYCADPANGIWIDTVAAVGAHIVVTRTETQV
jgi:peptidoglycan/xylan/chitin deacetylase (PgdA/CDA1 family)